ncbi:hypothetical protein, partial [Escherichia coli]|uniref:hypothetical protein n=1 Tax=Escherichia coli TaxID=562 RepID=UPI0013B3C770
GISSNTAPEITYPEKSRALAPRSYRPEKQKSEKLPAHSLQNQPLTSGFAAQRSALTLSPTCTLLATHG